MMHCMQHVLPFRKVLFLVVVLLIFALSKHLKNLQELGLSNEDQATGVNIVRLALESPLRTIAENAGQEGSVIVNKVRDGKKDYRIQCS